MVSSCQRKKLNERFPKITKIRDRGPDRWREKIRLTNSTMELKGPVKIVYFPRFFRSPAIKPSWDKPLNSVSMGLKVQVISTTILCKCMIVKSLISAFRLEEIWETSWARSIRTSSVWSSLGAKVSKIVLASVPVKKAEISKVSLLSLLRICHQTTNLSNSTLPILICPAKTLQILSLNV